VQKDKHTFAIFFEELTQKISALSIDEKLEVKDRALAHRIKSILRLNPGEEFVLFDKEQNAKVQLLEEKNKNILSAKILSISKNNPLKPNIILSFGLLKKEHLEDVAYYSAAMGANIVQPFFSSKVQAAKWGGEKEMQRLKKIMIAACEQSKNFCLPKIQNPITFDLFVQNTEGEYPKAKKVCFDVEGRPFFDLLSDLNEFKHENIILTFGPEGGLSPYELEKLKKAGWDVTKLTPTTLRAVESVAVGLGAVRSIG